MVMRGSVAFERAITGSRTEAVKAEAWLGGRRIAADLPVVAGTINGDENSFVRRTANLTFVDRHGSNALARTLARPGCEVRVWKGVYLGERPEFLPVHWGLAENPDVSWPNGRITLQSPDLAMRVSLDRFVRPRGTTRGMTVPQNIGQLVRESVPRLLLVDESQSSVAVADIVLERDRNEAVSKLATSIGSASFFRPDGSWLTRRISSHVGVAVLRVREGIDLVDASVKTDWSKVRNHIVVTSERADGPPLWAESADLDPNSPTYIHGPMRRRTGFYSSSLFTTAAQCQQTALALRSRLAGARVSVSWTSLVHPGVETGDRIDAVFDRETHRLILDSFSMDLFKGTLAGSGRSARPVLLEEVA